LLSGFLIHAGEVHMKATKTKLINIRVTETERLAMHEQAKRRNLTLSQFVRLLVLQNHNLEVKNERPTN